MTGEPMLVRRSFREFNVREFDDIYNWSDSNSTTSPVGPGCEPSLVIVLRRHREVIFARNRFVLIRDSWRHNGTGMPTCTISVVSFLVSCSARRATLWGCQ